MAPYLRQLNPDAERDMIKACSRLAYSKIKSKFKKYKKRPETSSSSSSSATSSSSEYSSQCTLDEDIFEEKKKKKDSQKKHNFTNTNVKWRSVSGPTGAVGQFTVRLLSTFNEFGLINHVKWISSNQFRPFFYLFPINYLQSSTSIQF